MADNEIRMSAIIATIGSPVEFGSLIDSIRNQNYPLQLIEIIILDQNTDLMTQNISEVFDQKYAERITEIITGQSGPGSEDSIPIMFSAEKLKNTGFICQGYITWEINPSLALCEQFLAGNRHD